MVVSVVTTFTFCLSFLDNVLDLDGRFYARKKFNSYTINQGSLLGMTFMKWSFLRGAGHCFAYCCGCWEDG